MKPFTLHMAVAVLAVLTLAGCSVVSKEVRLDVNEGATLTRVQGEPERYVGATVLWGGVIIGSENKKETTVIEVLETPLGASHSPTDTGRGSAGRFLIESTGYLDTVIYSTGKGVTVAGVFKGIVKKKIGEMEYPYAVVTPVELHLFDNPSRPKHPEPWPWWYPYYNRDPADPYYWPYRQGSPWYYP